MQEGNSGEDVVSWKACEESLEEGVVISAATRSSEGWMSSTPFGHKESDPGLERTVTDYVFKTHGIIKPTRMFQQPPWHRCFPPVRNYLSCLTSHGAPLSLSVIPSDFTFTDSLQLQGVVQVSAGLCSDNVKSTIVNDYLLPDKPALGNYPIAGN